MKNIIITGKPGSGKSTLLKDIMKGIPRSGLVTKEILDTNQKRLGFEMGSISSFKGFRSKIEKEDSLIAHVNFDTEYKVSRYGVNVSNIDFQVDFFYQMNLILLGTQN